MGLLVTKYFLAHFDIKNISSATDSMVYMFELSYICIPPMNHFLFNPAFVPKVQLVELFTELWVFETSAIFGRGFLLGNRKKQYGIDG